VNTLKDVKAIARSVNGDPDSEWMTDAYLLPIINHCYRLQINYLSKTCSLFTERVSVVPSLPAGTSDLSSFQKDPAKGLYGLWEPYRFGIDWKQAGLTDNHYRRADKVIVLPDINPATPGPRFSMWWEWRGNILFITPMTFDVDLRVRGDFVPPPLLKDDDFITIHPMLGDTLAEEVAACSWRERGNLGQMQPYSLVYTAALDDIASELVRSMQGTPLRIGKYTERRRRR
jgi:hypothetical protein